MLAGINKSLFFYIRLYLLKTDFYLYIRNNE